MHPELFTIPGLTTIKSYGFCLMVGFLTAVWFAMRRAMRVKANPDMVLNLAFICLLCGVGGARIFFVIHYWQVDFAKRANPLLAIIDLRAGGLEFIGGLLGAFVGLAVYMAIRRESLRLYLDILAPGAMWGLAFGRMGCFLNGCCFGGVCDAPWAVTFPYGSSVYVRQWENRQVSVPAELVNAKSTPVSMVAASSLSMTDRQRREPQRLVDKLQKSLASAKATKKESPRILELEGELAKAKKDLQTFRLDNHLATLEYAQRYPSRENPKRKTSVSELQRLAGQTRSQPVHPTQLYSVVHGFLLSGLLSAVFYRRKRHGVVVGLMFLLYSIARVVLESIRVDNPHDTVGLTISQFISLLMFVSAAAYLFVLYRFMPERSRFAVAYEPPHPSEPRS